MTLAAEHPTDLLQARVALTQLIDAAALEDVLGSFYALFRIPIRILDESGATLARSRKPIPLNDYLGELPRAAKLLADMHLMLRQREADGAGEFAYSAFTGASYHVAMIGHEGRCIGRFILGPFLAPEVAQPPPALLACDPQLDATRARELLLQLPRIRIDTVQAIARHLAVTLEALMFAGHRSLLTEYMHLSTVQENFRQVSENSAGLTAAHARLTDARRVTSELFAKISHELRGPLTDILAHSETMIAGASPEQQQGLALEIRRQAKQLLSLESRLLELAQVESGAFVLNKELVDPKALLELVRATLQAIAPERAGDVRVSCEEGLSGLCADAARLGRVLMLLGENAFLTADGPVRLEARRICPPEGADADLFLVLMGPPAQQLEFRVIDTGQGVPDVEKPSIFDPFHARPSESGCRAMASRLGLAIVKPLIEAHDGSVRVEDNQPRGAVFVVTLPLLAPQA
jgi:two-component system sensor histidine kinase BarA